MPMEIRYVRRHTESASADPLRILRWCVLAFLGGLSLALAAVLLNAGAGLAFMIAYCSTVVLALLWYWREAGRAISSLPARCSC